MANGGADETAHVLNVAETDELLAGEGQGDGEFAGGAADEEVEVALGGLRAVDVLRPDEGEGQVGALHRQLHRATYRY